MAGFYPDVPGNRFAYHLDGTKVFMLDAANTLTDLSSQAATINDEDGDYISTYGLAMLFIFPEPRDLSGYYINDVYGNPPYALQVSADTTTGLDGTWTTIVNPWIRQIGGGTPLPGYRNAINSAVAGSIKGVKFNMSNNYFRPMTIHLYGTIPTSSNPDRLIFWEPVNDNATSGAYFDWGDIAQGSTQVKSFRVKNNSSTKTANSVALSCGAETFGMTLDFSTDNVTFTASVNIGNLAPGALSSVLYVRRVVPAAEPLQLQASYLKAHASSWT